jgi:hypothetical protein
MIHIPYEIAPKINVFVVDVIVLPIDGYEKELVLAVVNKTLAEMNMKTTEFDSKDGPVLSLASRTEWLFPSYSYKAGGRLLGLRKQLLSG